MCWGPLHTQDPFLHLNIELLSHQICAKTKIKRLRIIIHKESKQLEK